VSVELDEIGGNGLEFLRVGCKEEIWRREN